MFNLFFCCVTLSNANKLVTRISPNPQCLCRQEQKEHWACSIYCCCCVTSSETDGLVTYFHQTYSGACPPLAGPHKIHGSTQQISHQTSSGTPSLLLYRIVKLKQLIYEIRDKQIAKEIFQVNQTYIIAGSGES